MATNDKNKKAVSQENGERKLTFAQRMAKDAEKRKAAAEKKKQAEAERKKAETERKKQAEAERKRAEAEKKQAQQKKKEAEAKRKASKATSQKTPSSKGGGKGIRFLGGLLFSKMAQGGANELSNNAEEVNKLNVFPVPDGDTGDNMKMTIESGVAAIEGLDTDNLAEVMHVLSHGMLLGARGNSGVILSQFFAGMAKGFEGIEQANPKALGKALEQGVEQAYASVMTPTEGTILTVARESVEYAVKNLHPQSTIKTFFQDLVDEMHASLDRTPEMLAQLKEAEVVDSGGAGLLYIMDGFNRVLNGKDVKRDEAVAEPIHAPTLPKGSENFGPDSEMTYGYCTELLIQLLNKKTDIDSFDIEALKSFLSGIGDSIVAFKTDSIVKVHVHTLTPERVLEHCRSFGEFLTVKIENMSVQHTEQSEEEPASAANIEPKTKPQESEPAKDESIPKKRYAVVSVCNGQGLIDLFTELGTDRIIIGGQSHNPSTNDFIDAFDSINAEYVFVLPNNGNIQMAASQAAEMYEKAKVYVVPSKIVGTGYVALAAADLDNPDPEVVYASMCDAINAVSWGYVSPSIRDAEIGGVRINSGDVIGVIGKEIVVSESNSFRSGVALADGLLCEEGRFMLTVFAGADTTSEERDQMLEAIKKVHPDKEIYCIDGGQEIYPYIFVAE